jgi:hypothetical protein
MGGRILTLFSCTLYFSILFILTAIGLTSIIIAFVGLGLYIPTSINYNTYINTTCSVLSHEYHVCHQQSGLCYSVKWSVEYPVLNQTSESYLFSNIKQVYDTPIEALNILTIYQDGNNYTCYYNKEEVLTVKWSKPESPGPYLIMMIVGFTLTGIYFIVIGFIVVFRCVRR